MTMHIDRPLTELAAALQQGQLSALSATRACLERIAERDGAMHAFIDVDAHHALQEAERRDAALHAGHPCGPLHGVPIAVKDLFSRPGMPTTAGSRVYPEPASTEAAVITRLRSAGAVVLGTLNLDEFAAGGTGINPHFGRCCNPWDMQRITGGSSSGSAAAVAAGMVPVSLGSDTGGSVRLPAAYCGVSAIKPGYGKVSLDGMFPRAPPFDTIAPVGRSVEDCEMLLSVIATGNGARTPATTAPMDPSGALAHAGTLRLGVAIRQFADEADAGVLARLFEAAGLLAGVVGAQRQIALPDIDLMTGLHQAVVKSEGARIHRDVLQRRAGEISLAARGAIEAGLFLDPALARQALAVRASMLASFLSQAFRDVDVVLAPVHLTVAPYAQDLSQSNANDIVAIFAQSGRACRFVNYLGLPALSLPCGFSDGMPVGLQLIGRPNREDQLFALGRAYQQMTDFHRRRPWDSSRGMARYAHVAGAAA